MDPSYFLAGGKPPPPSLQKKPQHPPPGIPPPPPKRQHQIQGPRPESLKIHQESHKITKNNNKNRQPVVLYDISPKVIHAEVSNFMSVVQRYTGLSSGVFSGDGDLSPAARLAATERAGPKERNTGSDLSSNVDIMSAVEGFIDSDEAPTGILSPAPGMLPSVPSGFFSPATDVNLMSSFLEDLSPSSHYFQGSGNGGNYVLSPSGFLSNPLASSSLPSPDVFKLLFDL